MQVCSGVVLVCLAIAFVLFELVPIDAAEGQHETKASSSSTDKCIFCGKPCPVDCWKQMTSAFRGSCTGSGDSWNLFRSKPACRSVMSGLPSHGQGVFQNAVTNAHSKWCRAKRSGKSKPSAPPGGWLKSGLGSTDAYCASDCAARDHAVGAGHLFCAHKTFNCASFGWSAKCNQAAPSCYWDSNSRPGCWGGCCRSAKEELHLVQKNSAELVQDDSRSPEANERTKFEADTSGTDDLLALLEVQSLEGAKGFSCW
jgi:hypothetical protein